MLTLLVAIGSLLLVAWWAGAIYYDLFGETTSGAWAAAAWTGVWLILFVVWRPEWKPLALLLLASLFLAWWWLLQRPSQDRDWDQHFARVARVALDGDVITIDNVRNSEYGDDGASAARFEVRTYHLSALRGLDALLLTWGSPWMSHPMFVFDFGPDGRVCISVEVRYRRGQRFSFTRSLFRQQELVYVVSDERDAILRRTRWLTNHHMYLYRLDVGGVAQRQFFLDYAARINDLAARPQWYHGLTTNCTTSIYAQSRGHMKWHWRMLLNGSLDRLLYDREFVDRSLPFEELRRQSWINELANSAPERGFGDFLRALLQARQRLFSRRLSPGGTPSVRTPPKRTFGNSSSRRRRTPPSSSGPAASPWRGELRGKGSASKDGRCN
jgi:hypothetical protein